MLRCVNCHAFLPFSQRERSFLVRPVQLFSRRTSLKIPDADRQQVKLNLFEKLSAKAHYGFSYNNEGPVQVLIVL